MPTTIIHPYKYCNSLTEYSRRKTIEVSIGDLKMGSMHPIRVQSMTTVDTMDTMGSVEQSIRMIKAGCELVRITAPSVKEAQNLAEIKKELHARGYFTPIVADIHFTPNAAELAARIVEKVRINPGNYADKKRFENIEYTDQTYQAELERIRTKFLPLLKICKEYGTAMRIGTNHGSLSDRILSRYGDTPIGMVESALEFIRICESEGYYNLVVSMKASNTQVMVQAYRLLVNKLEEEGLRPYPLHLGVTEAGEAEDGRIKSAVGIGALLEDGLGDTVRVSLTEDPEFEMPVAKALIERYNNRLGHKPIKPIEISPINPYEYNRYKTNEVGNIGGHNVPRVIADFSSLDKIRVTDLKTVGHFYFPLTDKWNMNDQGCDYIYSGNHPINYMLPNGLKEILNYSVWEKLTDKNHRYPLLTSNEYLRNQIPNNIHFVETNYKSLTDEFYAKVNADKNVILIIDTNNEHAMSALRRVCFYLTENGVHAPIIIKRKFPQLTDDQFLLSSATDTGGLFIDGFGDGIFLSTELLNQPSDHQLLKKYNETAFGILQAARMRMSKTEYISCPSCGRTLFDLQETTAMIRKRTDHLKGIKIGIMGCIVNGPGEMADADYGYVGVGKDKIALYRGKEVIKRSVEAENALDELIELIKEDGNWIEGSY
ncbi:MAG: (E)-4-hydroxy-3-methylbut-2-enyl-diphosphate synthase [Bacteroidota bacterium]|nr:(E)-4-hydroxy-3-methylbut-2-enyl-diphosphate synthase [Bacteroidota bacterium]